MSDLNKAILKVAQANPEFRKALAAELIAAQNGYSPLDWYTATLITLQPNKGGRLNSVDKRTLLKVLGLLGSTLDSTAGDGNQRTLNAIRSAKEAEIAKGRKQLSQFDALPQPLDANLQQMRDIIAKPVEAWDKNPDAVLAQDREYVRTQDQRDQVETINDGFLKKFKARQSQAKDGLQYLQRVKSKNDFVKKVQALSRKPIISPKEGKLFIHAPSIAKE